MIPPAGLRWLFKMRASRETSAGQELWTKENPLFGHCAVAAVLAQDFLGGKITSRFFPAEWAERFQNRSHYWNVLASGENIDLSREQFPPEFPWDDFVNGKIGEPRGEDDKRSYILGNDATRQRYGILSDRVWDFLEKNQILLDAKFQRCWELAFSEKAKCPKFRFACLVYDGERLIAEDANRLMTEQFGKERFCSLDGSRCERMKFGHRLDPTVGDCGHAPLWCLARVFENGYKPSDLPRLDFYEAGFSADGEPWRRPEPTYTCIYCENMFAVFGLDKIWGVYDMKWTKLLTSDSFYSSAGYATGEKKA